MRTAVYSCSNAWVTPTENIVPSGQAIAADSICDLAYDVSYAVPAKEWRIMNNHSTVDNSLIVCRSVGETRVYSPVHGLWRVVNVSHGGYEREVTCEVGVKCINPSEIFPLAGELRYTWKEGLDVFSLNIETGELHRSLTETTTRKEILVPAKFGRFGVVLSGPIVDWED